MGALRDHLVAALWGAAEATFFVVVPDVWISRVALTSPRRALATTGSALVGALVGGTLTHRWGARTAPARSSAALTRLPAISARMVEQVETDLDRQGHRALLTGPTRGVPYKIYARTSGLQGRSLAGFLAWSVPARMARFLLLAVLPVPLHRLGRAALGKDRADRLAPWTHTAAWTAFYVWFLRTVGRD